MSSSPSAATSQHFFQVLSRVAVWFLMSSGRAYLLKVYSCRNFNHIIVELSLDSRGKSSVGSTYSPVSPIAHIIPPYLCFQFCHSVVLRLVITTVKEFFFHPGPHTFAAGIVMTPTAGTVHALNYSILLDRCAIFCTCVLTSSVRVNDASINVGVRFLCIFKGMTAERSPHVIFDGESERHQIKAIEYR